MTDEQDPAEFYKDAAIKTNGEVCQILGQALGYPQYKDDPLNFPGATDTDGVCVGEHVAESIAMEAAHKIELLETMNKELHSIMDNLFNLRRLAGEEINRDVRLAFANTLKRMRSGGMPEKEVRVVQGVVELMIDLDIFAELFRRTGWSWDISAAPKDQPVLAICKHDADPYFLSDGKMTAYAVHAEGLGHAEDGPHVIEWHDGFWDEGPSGEPARLPGWWFRRGSNAEEPANPIAWMPIPDHMERES